MTPSGGHIICSDLSKFYGEVLGVNRVNLTVPPGITSLVGPNGSGKTTLMNLITGLVQPSRGTVSVLGRSPSDPENFFRLVGYATQFDSFPRGFTGFDLVYAFLRLSGGPAAECERRAWAAIERVGLREAAGRKIAGYSKGMRQRIKLAQALSHDPPVLVLDEPLNGLDPLVRAETIALFRTWAREGRHVIVSSHVLHEVDLISDQVILMSAGYVVAEGEIRDLRNEIEDQPMQILVRCDRPALAAARLFAEEAVVEARVVSDGRGVLVKTKNPERFYLLLNRLALEEVEVETVAPADEDVNSLYQYLIGGEEATR